MHMFHELCRFSMQTNSPEIAQKIEEAIQLTAEFREVSEFNAMLANGCMTFAEWRSAVVAVLV